LSCEPKVDLVAARAHRAAAGRHEDAAMRLRALGLTEAAAAADRCAEQQHALADMLEGTRAMLEP
jgi:hypothetical protein